MKYDEEFWNKYAVENDSKYNEEFSKFIRDLALSLRAGTVLEVGCSTGNDLKAFPDSYKVNGVDLCEYALEKAREKLPSFNFQKGSITDLPFEDASFDLVFSHRVLNYLDDSDIEGSIKEMFRVSKKYIVNCELFGENSKKDFSDNSRDSNIYEKWLNYKVKIISNVDMHEEIDPERSRFTLVRKL